jgi:hypothetical protein
MLVVATWVKRQTANSRSTALHCTALHCTALHYRAFIMCFKKVQNNCRYEYTPRRVNVFEIGKLLTVFSEVSLARSTLPRLSGGAVSKSPGQYYTAHFDSGL